MPPTSSELTQLTGIIQRIIHYNETDNYAIFILETMDTFAQYTLVGNVGPLSVGQNVACKGEWVTNPKYGKQFQVKQYKIIYPNTMDGIQRYLASGLIEGIGKEYARRIVSVFGKKTLDIIDSSPRRLLDVPGIGKARYEKIRNSWEKNKIIQDIMIFLQSQKISTTFALKIYKRYGNQTIPLLKENPYRLADDIFGIGFQSADKMAQEMGIEHDSPVRIQAYSRYFLRSLSQLGHVFVPFNHFLAEASKEINVSTTQIAENINHLVQEKKIVRESLDKPLGPSLFLPSLAFQEREIARMLSERIGNTGSVQPLLLSNQDFQEFLTKYQQHHQLQLASMQEKALEMALKHSVLIITGGPGTGKTTIIRGLLHLFKMYTGIPLSKIQLCAPTGRAAKRLEETSQHTASTIHRMLKFQPGELGFQVNKEHPLAAQVLIIDESSMIDQPMFYQILSSLSEDCNLIMVGDADQLPSVGPGNILNDLIQSDCVPFVRLNQVFRQNEHSYIKVNAHAINNGEMPVFEQSKNQLTDFYFIEKETPEEILSTFTEVYFNRIPNRFGFQPGTSIQVLSPMRRGQLGVQALNQMIQEQLQTTHALEDSLGGFFVGDRVMQLRNNYNKEVFNGDIGFVKQVDLESNVLIIQFENTLHTYEKEEWDELQLAYAITIHKSQGSEFQAVVIPLHTQHYMMLQRNLLYTAITRAQKLVVLIGNKKALSMAISNRTMEKRYTYLAARLKKSFLE